MLLPDPFFLLPDFREREVERPDFDLLSRVRDVRRDEPPVLDFRFFLPPLSFLPFFFFFIFPCSSYIVRQSPAVAACTKYKWNVRQVLSVETLSQCQCSRYLQFATGAFQCIALQRDTSLASTIPHEYCNTNCNKQQYTQNYEQPWKRWHIAPSI